MKKHFVVLAAVVALFGIFNLGQSWAVNSLPYCGAIGTRSEGWYSPEGNLIKYDNCSSQTAACLYPGTRSEGWYSSEGNLIKYGDCDGTVLPTMTATPMVTAVPSAAPIPYPCRDIFPTLRYGWQGQEVRELQAILSRDKSIYPEGSVTGFFGEKTKAAVSRLQKQLDLRETGELSQELMPYLYPCYQVSVVYPNGGESFKVGETMKVSWKTTWPNSVLERNSVGSSSGMPLIKYSKYLLSVDLIEVEASSGLKCQGMPGYKCSQTEKVVFHIRNINTSKDEDSFEWQIPASIPESKDYKIRVSSGLNTSDCPPGAYCAMKQMTDWYATDDSDGVFAISGGSIKPTPSVTPIIQITPLPESSLTPELLRIRTEVAEMIKRLQAILESLIGIFGR